MRIHHGFLIIVLIGAALYWSERWPFVSALPSSPQTLTTEADDARRQTLASNSIIADTDLPPAGTHSLFDHHIHQAGGLPYPFSALLDSLKAKDLWDQGSVGLLIPDGRSLAKAHADYRQPRVLAAAQLTPKQAPDDIATIYSGRLFLGFVESINTIEIIAYNEAAGRFEFQLVKNYCEGCEPQVLYAKRAICMACHQSGSPIFAVRPWSESNANAQIARRIADAQALAWDEASQALYHGVSVSTQILAAESFDELVLSGSRIQLAQQSWLDGCSNTECRRQLLAQALKLLLEPGDFDPQSTRNVRLKQLQAQNWPETGLPVADDQLPDRIPTPPSRWHSLRKALRQQWTIWRGQAAEPPSSSDRLAALDDLPRIEMELDPLNARPPAQILGSDSLQGTHALAKMFIPQDRKTLQRWSAQSAERVYTLILNGQLDTELQALPFSRSRILKALAQALNQDEPASHLDSTATLAPPRAEDPQALSIRPGSALHAFARYCFDCHRGNPVEHLNFMSGSSEAEVLRSIRNQARIHELLDYQRELEARGQLMPPAASAQRRQLEAALQNGLDDLERMQRALH